ncbi:MAG: HAD-IC family P-type ATPase [Anaerolineae bacterium]|nr:HAD-IC family P-type ATPase [Anaerolineae bacterium]
MSVPVKGLSTAEVLERQARGLGNRDPVRTSRSYFQIIRENVFTFVNLVLFGLGTALVLLGRPSDAIVSVLVILFNVIVSVVQEIRAKRTLDRIALLTRPRATVLRDGQEQAVDPGDIVLGDILILRPGDQVVVDGQLVGGVGGGTGRAELDESLLTGESDLIRKQSGDLVYSGSFCVTGSVLYEAQKVGIDSLASQLTTSARAFRRVLTPLQQQINLAIRVILVLAVYLELLLVIRNVLDNVPLVESVRMSVVIVGLVPNGLFLAISIAYALGAVRMVGKGVLVQQANAIESLSNVDVLCLDKTGTLTANRIQFNALKPLAVPEEDLRQALGDLAANVTFGNRTNAAIAQACPGRKRSVAGEIPFSSARKYSALAFDDPDRRGTYVLGAPEVLQPAITYAPPAEVPAFPGRRLDLGQQAVVEEQIASWADQGLRVLIFAAHPEVVSLTGEDGQPQLPEGLIPFGLVSLSEELRPEAQTTLSAFAQAGVRLKVISGDSPRTLATVARQVGFPSAARLVSGLDLEQMSPDEFARAAREGDIFGRITPTQKERLVQALWDAGHYVAMVGDGVNDVLALKRANLAVAMQGGSQATRAVADIVLLDDSFAALPASVQEGRRIITGMQDILKLFLTRVFAMTLMILSVGILASFPFSPKHITILTLFTVGIPSIALAAWARPGAIRREGLLRRLWHFVLPASLTLGLAGLAVFLAYSFFSSGVHLSIVRMGGAEADLEVSQSAVTHFALLCGLFLIVFAEPPTRFWVGGDELSGDRRPALLALALLAAYAVVLAVSPVREFFDLAPLSGWSYLLLGAGAAVWAFLLRWIWRAGWMERFLDIERVPTDLGND